MENELQPVVKKRLIYAEDLFEPVDFTVVQMGGRSGGKTMAMYEELFRKRVEMAPTIEAEPVVHAYWIYEKNSEMRWTTKAICSACKSIVENNVELSHEYGRENHEKRNKRCRYCGAHMDLKEADHGR